MSFLAVLFALIIEQARPLAHHNWVHTVMRGWTRWVRASLDAGQRQHGVLVWCVAVGVPTGVTMLIHLALWSYSLVLTLVWSVTILYVTLGFRQFSHHFTDIRGALERGDERAALEAFASWQRVPVASLSGNGLLRQVIDYSVLAVHRHVLGVLVCFVVFWVVGLGPAGAVLYRLSDYMARSSAQRQPGKGVDVLDSASVSAFAARAWTIVNFVPARATAMAFAIVGNFEEAVANWRTAVPTAGDPNDGLVLVAAAGAMNLAPSSPVAADADGGLARQPELAHLASVVGLVWRSVVLWMLFLALLTLAHSVG